jgi:hypothetical protein
MIKTRNIPGHVAISLLALLALATLLFSGCGRANESTSVPTSAARSPEPQTPFERDLDYVRKGQFTYVLVFSRKDGGVFDKDDITFLKANSPSETNQWISSEDGRRVIAGTNFEFKPEHLTALNQRFNIEDMSGK